MIKKILVGTDTSASADMAVAAAAELARKNDAELLVLYVKPRQAARDAFDPKKAPDPGRYLHGLARRFPGVRTATRESEGDDPARVITQVAAEERSDLVVVGNRGAADRRRFGSERVPNAVVRTCPCSVLVVDTRAAQ